MTSSSACGDLSEWRCGPDARRPSCRLTEREGGFPVRYSGRELQPSARFHRSFSRSRRIGQTRFVDSHNKGPPLLPPVRVRLLATRCARHRVHWWRPDTLTDGAEYETSAGSAGSAAGDGRVWGGKDR